MISSTRNARVRAAAGLARRKEREARGRYLIEGPHGVADALADGAVVEVFATPEGAGTVADAARRAGVGVTLVTEKVMGRLSDAVTPQGVVAVARQPRWRPADIVGRPGPLVVLCEISDPGNAGTIVRTCDAAGAAGVVLTEGSVDPFNPKAVRAAAGSLTHLPVLAGPPVEEVLASCREQGRAVVALDVGGDRELGRDPLPPPPLALVFGSEAHGLPGTVREAVDAAVSIPRFGRAESLNLAAAVAVAAYAAAWAERGGSAGG